MRMKLWLWHKTRPIRQAIFDFMFYDFTMELIDGHDDECPYD